MGILVVITGVMLSHASLPAYVEIPQVELVRGVQLTWKVDSAKAEILAEGARLGGWLGNIHPAWLLANSYFESRFNFRVMGDCSRSRRRGRRCLAYGLGQIHYRTGKSVLSGLRRGDLLRPIINLAVAGLLYGKYIRRYGRRKAHAVYAGCLKCTSTPTFKRRYKLMKKLIHNIKER